MQLKVSLAVIVGAPLLLACCTSSACQIDVPAVLADECMERSISLTAFVHASRHGMWISSDPGINGEGIVILLKEADMTDDGVKRLISYGRNYSKQRSHAFKATFNGLLKCSASNKPDHLLVKDVDKISLMPIRDAQEKLR